MKTSIAVPKQNLLRRFRCTALGFLAVGLVAPIRPCTTFDLIGNGSIVYGRNFDYYASDGRVMVNRRGLQKNVFGTGSGLQWVSRYGSLTFNQFGHEFPNGGINVAGALADPQFRVVPLNQNFTVASNDNWGGTAALQAAFAQTYAFALPTDSLDAAAVVRLPPGGYTVQATGVGNTTGNVLVEVYDMDP